MRLSLFREEVVFSWWAGRAGAHYLVPAGDGDARSCTLVTYDDCSFLVSPCG